MVEDSYQRTQRLPVSDPNSFLNRLDRLAVDANESFRQADFAMWASILEVWYRELSPYLTSDQENKIADLDKKIFEGLKKLNFCCYTRNKRTKEILHAISLGESYQPLKEKEIILRKVTDKLTVPEEKKRFYSGIN